MRTRTELCLSNWLGAGPAQPSGRIWIIGVFIALSAAAGCLWTDCVADVDWAVGVELSNKPSEVKTSAAEKGMAYDLWAGILVTNYGVTVEFVTKLYDRGYDYGDVCLLLEVAKDSGKKPVEVAELKSRGLGWGAIAKRLGVHPSSLERAKGNESLFKRYQLVECLGRYYGMPDNSGLVLLNERGYDFDEIVLAVNLSAHTGTPLRDIVVFRQGGKKWRLVAEKFKMSPAKLSSLHVRATAEEKKKSKQKDTGKEKTEAKGRDEAKDKGKGQDKTGEKSAGKDKDKD